MQAALKSPAHDRAQRQKDVIRPAMPNHPLHAAPTNKGLFPAWLFSAFFHAIVFVLAGFVLRPWTEGASKFGDDSIGIVLNNSGDEAGDIRAGDEGQGDTPYDPYEVVRPPELLPVPFHAQGPQSAAESRIPARLAAAPIAQTSHANAAGEESRPAGGVGRSGTPGGTGYAKVSVFGVEGKGNKFVYLFDRSASMDGAPLSAAKKQLLESLKSLDSVHQFQIIFFNSKTRVFDASGGGHRVAFASDRNKQLAANFVGGITADGGTDRMVALREAIGFAPNVIFFLSDADDPMSDTELTEIAKLNRRVAAAICVIEFGRQPNPPANNFLMRLARDSGGKYGYVDTTKLDQPQNRTNNPVRRSP